MTTGLTGTYSIDDLIAMRFANAKKFGFENIAEVLQIDIDAHNTIVGSMMTDLCEVTMDARRLYGSTGGGTMTEVDPLGKASTRSERPGSAVCFPLRDYQYATGFATKWLENATVADVAIKQKNAEAAHLREVRKQIAKAIFNNANSTFNDFLVDNIPLAVKALVNADGAAIPDSPWGDTFNASTHTHYFSGSAALTTWNMDQIVNTVIEHGHGQDVVLAINTAQEVEMRALTGFTAYIDPRLTFIAAPTGLPGTRLDITKLNNRAIGIFHASEVWVKPWVPALYQFAYSRTDERKTLAFRQRNNGTGMVGLKLAAEFDTYPLNAQYYEAEFGIAPWTRTNGAVNFETASGYVVPTIT
jgi:hypothetical protein